MSFACQRFSRQRYGHVVQLVRDLCSWCGLRQVSRRTFVRALQEKGSVMLVPGGQAELVHTWRIKCKKEYVVYGKHKGQLPSLQFPVPAMQSKLPLFNKSKYDSGPRIRCRCHVHQQ